jgi:hypothetical protein
LVIDKVKQARADIKISLVTGNDTLAAYADYFKRYDKLFVKLAGKMADPKDEPLGICGMGTKSFPFKKSNLCKLK